MDSTELQAALLLVDSSLRQLRGKHILLLGGTGFVGKWLLRLLIAFNRQSSDPVKISVLSRQPQLFLNTSPQLTTGVRFINGDIHDFGLLDDSIDLVIHGATDTALHATMEGRDAIIDSITSATDHVLEVCHSLSIDALLLLSSGAVYGNVPSVIDQVAEDFYPHPGLGASLSAYGEGKRRSEVLCLDHGRDHRLIIARGFTFAGPYLPLDAHFAFGNFLADGLRGEAIMVRGDGSPIRSYMYGGDLAIWLLRLLTEGVDGRTYNVGSDEPLSILELAGKFADVFPNSKVVCSGAPESYNATVRYLPDITRARTELGVDIWTDIDTIISRAKSWAENRFKD